ncbi:MAG: hypothetical protein ACREJ2_00510, partial [Planctomycetota bacterium]
MKAHLAFAAVCCLAVAGCGPSEPTPAPVSTAATPATSVPAKAAADTTSDIAGPDYSAVVVPVFLPYQQPVYAYKNLPVFGALVHFEQNVAAVEPFLKPVHPRLHIDWKNLADHTRLIDWSIVAAINENLRTALDQHPTGGGMPTFGLEFQHDLINLRQVTRELNAAAETQDLGTARNRFAALEILLGPRPAVLTGNATPPAQATQSAQPAQSAGSAGS